MKSAVSLLDEGNTIPFIARYRKEMTGELDENELRSIEEKLQYMRNLEERKREVIRLIDEQGKLTEELRKRLTSRLSCRKSRIYTGLTGKSGKRELASQRKGGLEPLAVAVVAARSGDPLAEAARYVNAERRACRPRRRRLKGAMDIIAENIADDA